MRSIPLLAFAAISLAGCASNDGTISEPSPVVTPGGAGGVPPGAVPTASPTTAPTAAPTATPTSVPTSVPTAMPTSVPTPTPTSVPTSVPTVTPTTTGTVDPPPVEPPPDTRPRAVVSTVDFDVPPGGEAFKCQNFKNPLGKDIAIVESHSLMAPGSHHMFLFREPAIVADSNAVEDCSGIEFRDYVHLAQQPEITWTYPDGVARLLHANDGLRVAVHYVNTTSDVVTGHVTVTLIYEDPSAARYLAAPIFLNQAFLSVPPGASTASRQFLVPYPIQMLRSVGHMHSRGAHFSATASTGQQIYDTTSWDEPEERLFTPPLEIPGGSTITWSCTYQNPTTTVFTFGESASVNEMCIMYGLFYPSDAGANQGVSLGGLL